MAPDDTDPDVRDLRERVSDLETDKQKLRARLDDQQETIQKLMPSRRQTLAGLGLLSAGGVVGRLSSGTAKAQAAGQVGTETDPVDVQAWDLNVQGAAEGLLQNPLTETLDADGNDVTGVGALEAESIQAANGFVAGELLGEDSGDKSSLSVTVSNPSEYRLFNIQMFARISAGFAPTDVEFFCDGENSNNRYDVIEIGGVEDRRNTFRLANISDSQGVVGSVIFEENSLGNSIRTELGPLSGELNRIDNLAYSGAYRDDFVDTFQLQGLDPDRQSSMEVFGVR